MTDAGASTESTNAPLRIVLFGPPGAGKSSLVAALSKIQREHAEALRGDLVSADGETSASFHNLVATSEEHDVIPYPISYRPERSNRARAAAEAELIDTDGRITAGILRQDPASNGHFESGVASAVWQADALVVAIQASATDKQIEWLFEHLGRFLQELEQRRSSRIEIGRLPVFVVLTKSDLIAAPADTFMDWVDRAQDRHERLRRQLETFLATSERKRPVGFGSLELHSWATAVQRPQVKNLRSDTHQPWNVVELLWQCLDAAKQHRRRRQKLDNRLSWTTLVSVSVTIGLMLLIAAFLLGFGKERRTQLEERIDKLRNNEPGSPAGRLHAETFAEAVDLQQRRTELRQIRADAGFDELAHIDQEYVTTRLDELDRYLPWLIKLDGAYSLMVARDQNELDERERRLRSGDLKPPDEKWIEKTGAGKIWRRYVTDVALTKEHAPRIVKHLEERRKTAVELWTLVRWTDPESSTVVLPDGGGFSWQQWRAAASSFLESHERPWPGIKDLPKPGSVVTRYSLAHFGPVKRASEKLEKVVEHLRSQHNVSLALGLGRRNVDRDAVLVIQNNFSLENAKDKMAALVMAFPNYDKELRLEHLSEKARNDVILSRTLHDQYRAVGAPARALVLEQFRKASTGNVESHAHWKRVANWLAGDPKELADWRRLAAVLHGLIRAERADPVDELERFLLEDSMPIQISKAILEVPDISPIELKSREPLTIRVGGRVVLMRFSKRITGVADKSNVIHYEHVADSNDKLAFRPGDNVSADIKILGRKQLTWVHSRTRAYQIECLLTSPWLHDENESPRMGQYQSRIKLILPVGAVPDLPDLLPRTTP